MSSIRNHFLQPLKIITLAFFLIVAIAWFYLTSTTGINYDCKKYNYTAKLNGGIKEFSGKEYTIKICGSGTGHGGLYANDPPDVAELTITNEQGELLVKRHYTIEWDGKPGHEPLTIEQYRIIYQDDKDQKNHIITMPPSFFDRMKAKYLF